MNISPRLAAAAAVLTAVIGLSVLGTAGAASATTPIPPIDPKATISPVSPIKLLALPQLKIVVNYPQIDPSGTEWWTASAKASDGNPLVGTLRVLRNLNDGSGWSTLYTAPSNAAFVSGVGEPMPPAPVGTDPTVALVFAPAGGGASSQAQVAYQVRYSGSSVGVVIGSATAGMTVPVSATVAVPSIGAGKWLGGVVGFRVDGLGELAHCTPTAVTSTVGTCSATLPASLAAGTHTLVAAWTSSPLFKDASGTGTFAISPAPKAPTKPIPPATSGSGTGSGKSGATSGATASAMPSAAAPDPATSPTVAAATGANGVSTPRTLPVTTTSSTIPLWAGIAIAIVLIALLAIAAIVTVVVVRGRRARTAG